MYTQKGIDFTQNINKLCVSAFNINIFENDMSLLTNNQRINDNLIDFYFNIISSSVNRVKCLSISSLFFVHYVRKGVIPVSWIKKSLNDYDLILIPIIFKQHWTLLSFDIPSNEVTHLNSLNLSGKANDDLVKIIFQFAQKLTALIDSTRRSWKYRDYLNLPQQTNDIDCGIFACTFAKYIAHNGSFNFNFMQNDIDKIRSKMFNEILKVELCPDENDVKFNPTD